MSTQTPLLPTLYSLLPSSSHLQTTSRLSLQSLHIEPFVIHDSIYISTNPIIPNQYRSLRLRARRRYGGQTGRGKGEGEGRGGDWEYLVTYLSPVLSAREYSEMSVRACVGVDVEGMSSRREVEDFVETLGFRQTHSYSRKGLLFHLPLPTPALTLHLTITHFRPNANFDRIKDGKEERTSEPYLIELQPSRPVQAVAGRGELGLQDTMRLMRDAADRIDDLEWSTGR